MERGVTEEKRENGRDEGKRQGCFLFVVFGHHSFFRLHNFSVTNSKELVTGKAYCTTV